VNLATEVLFNFDKRDMGNVIESTKNKLDALIAQIKAGGFKVDSILLVGHADGSNFTRKPDYNTVLSQDRAEAVKAYMMSQGITAVTFNTDAKADSMPMVPTQECRAKHKQQTAFENCLLPNRRVVVNVSGVK
jgi:outer membrane protein OmpA-like peptidoglycan-associated protein